MRKRYAYLVIESTCPTIKVGALLLYTQNRGTTHSELVINTNTGEESSYFSMEQVGPCWIVDGKAQFEKPPAKLGVLTEGIMAAVRKRGRELNRTKPKCAAGK